MPNSSFFTNTVCSIVTSSQPATTTDVEPADSNATATVESFTQPSRFDELIIGTQIPCTPGASQVRERDREREGRWFVSIPDNVSTSCVAHDAILHEIGKW